MDMMLEKQWRLSGSSFNDAGIGQIVRYSQTKHKYRKVGGAHRYENGYKPRVIQLDLLSLRIKPHANNFKIHSKRGNLSQAYSALHNSLTFFRA